MAHGHKELFSDGDLSTFLNERKLELKSVIESLPEAEFLAKDEDGWSIELRELYALELPRLNHDDEYLLDSEEAKIDVSGDRNRMILDRDKPFLVPGRSVLYRMPFDGSQVLMRTTASTYSMNPPRANLVGNELSVKFEFPSGQEPDLRGEIDQFLQSVESHLEWQSTQVSEYNDSLVPFARSVIESRRSRILSDRKFLGGIGIPIRARNDAPSTYSAPGVTRKASPSSEGSSKGAKPLEPILVNDFFDHICEVVRAGGRAMERTPAAYRGRDEETLRDFLLTMLNTHYEGQATGETFQMAGKTDILVRVANENVFVGECKWWKGARGFQHAIDQLYSYTTLRDTKLALVVFVGAKDFGGVVEKARAEIESHKSFIRWNASSEVGEMSAEVAAPDDATQRARLHVFLFHLPE